MAASKGQYKGRKNFARIAEFPSQHSGVELVHRFSASHHFKGPHDQYGKDAKALTRTPPRRTRNGAYHLHMIGMTSWLLRWLHR